MRSSVKYLISVMVSISFLACAWVWLFYSQLGMPTRNTYWTHSLVQNKSLAAMNSVGEKIIIIAGSSGNFNVDAQKVSTELGIKTVNFGTHAILPLEYMLDHIKGALHSGDTAVIALEYLYYAADERLSSSYLDYLLARDPEYFRTRPLTEKLKILSAVSFKRLITPFKESFLKPEEPYAFNVYTDFFYSPYGDQHSNNIVFLNQLMRSGRDAAPPEFRIQSLQASEYNWNLIRGFNAWCDRHGVKLLAAPPATMKFPIYETASYKNALALLKRSLEGMGIPLIGDPYSVMYDRSLFFDTNYHTNNFGKAAYTDALTGWLKAYVPTQGTALPVEPAVDNPVDDALKNFYGWMPIAGLLTLEGPYPASHLPVVVWGAPQVQFRVETQRAGRGVFRIEFQPNKAEQPIKILVDGRQVFNERVVKGATFNSAEATFDLSAGEHTIVVLSDDQSDSLSGTSILFRSIKFIAM